MPAPVSGTLDNPKHHREAKFLGNLGHRLKVTSFNLDGLIEVMSVNFFLQTYLNRAPSVCSIQKG